jgi:RND family efflux transporter MFP subunit
MNRSVLIAPVVLLSLGAASCQSSLATAEPSAEAAPVSPSIDVPVVRVATAPIEAALEISGTLTPRSRVPVKPRVPGTLERVMVDIGDAVTAGQPIATIDRREIDAQADAAAAAVAVAKAALENARAALENAELEHERARVLFDRGALPRQRLDAAETARRAAAAQRDLATASLAQSEASHRRAREVQRDTTVTAPVTGFVVERNYDAGAMPGDLPIVVVADLRELKLEAGVSELDAGRLRVGMKARVLVQAKPGQTFDGHLAAIAPEVNERNRHFQIEVRVPNPSRELLSGMYASARLVETSADAALVVPREAVSTRDGRRFVLKVDGDAVTAVEVREGLSDGQRIQILSGLAAGDAVVADARRQIPAGAKVRPVPID